MNKNLRITVVSLLALIASACVHNNGNIGPLFGTWALDAMIIDGTPETLPADANTFMMFQSKIVKIQLVDSRTTFLGYCLGSWEREGDVLEMNFNHYDNQHEPGTGLYEAPAWLYFQPKGITKLRIIWLKGSTMKLEQTTGDGRHIEYEFHKTY